MNGKLAEHEKRYNAPDSKVVTDESWGRYFSKKPTKKKKRMNYTINKLHGHVLDVGIGDGLGIYLMLRSPDIKYITGLDMHKASIQTAYKNLPHERDANYSIQFGFAERMVFENDLFDSIHCGATLEHVVDDEEALSECRRVLKPGGNIIITVPTNQPPDGIQHVRMYKRKSALALFNKYFRQKEVKMFGHTLFYEGVK